MALTSTLLPLALPGNQGQYAASTSDSGGDMSDSQGGSQHRVRTVTLNRRRHCTTFGFSLRGGREHGTGFFISAVDVPSEAHTQGLMVGDQIVRINGFPVADATHREVLQLIQGQITVTLKVRSVGMIPVKDSYNDVLTWKIVETDSSLLPTSLSSNQSDIICDEHPALQSQNDVRLVLHVAPKAKLGCGICKGPEWRPGIFVQFTKENGLARGAGLRPGDQILQCNNITFTPDTPFNEAVSVLRSSGLLELIVRKGAGLDLFPGESSGYNSSASSVAGDQSPETWLNKRLSIVKEESIIDSEGRFSHSDITNRNCIERRDPQTNSTTPCTSTKSTNTESTRTVIHVGPDDLKKETSTSETTECHKNKLAEICMVSQQTETKTTTVLVEVHQSEEEGGPKMDNSGLLNSSSTSSFTSSSNNSLSSAISQELQRRSQRRASETSDISRCEKSSPGRNLDIVRSGLDKEKVQQHEQLMEEFKLAHRRMFSNGHGPQKGAPFCPTTASTSSTSSQERESSLVKENQVQQEQPRLPQQTHQPSQNQHSQPQKIDHQSHPQLHKQPSNEERSQPPVIKSQNSTKTFYKEPCHQRNVLQERETARIPVRNRQHNGPPPPPPLPASDKVDGSSISTVKLPNMAPGRNGVGAVVSIHSPPSPPACPTPDYDTMSVASEHDVKQPCGQTSRPLTLQKNINGIINKSKSSIIVNGKCPNADCVEMESLESFKLTNPSTVKPKPPPTYFAQNTSKNTSRSSDSSLNSRTSVPNVAIESAKPTITIREYPTTVDRKNPTRFHFLNHNTSSTNVCKDQPITCQFQNELTQTLSRANLKSSSEKPEVTSAVTVPNSNGKSIVTICVNARQNQKLPHNSVSTIENKNQAPFYLHRQSDDSGNHPKMVSTTMISRPDLSEVEMKKSNLRSASESGNKNTVTFNFGCNEKTESRTVSIFQQPNGILKNGSTGNISQVQIQNIQQGAAGRGPPQKTIKFGGITTIIRNSPEPKM